MEDDNIYDYHEVTCFNIGMSGSCDLECPVLLHGDCENENEMLEDLSPEELEELPEEFEDRKMVLIKQEHDTNFDLAMKLFNNNN